MVPHMLGPISRKILLTPPALRSRLYPEEVWFQGMEPMGPRTFARQGAVLAEDPAERRTLAFRMDQAARAPSPAPPGSAPTTSSRALR